MANEFIIRKGFKSLQDSELTGSLNLSGNIVADGTVQAEFASNTSTAISGAFDSVSSSLASELLKNTTDTLTGDLTVTGTLTAQDLHVQEVTSSIVYSSGSNIFGSLTSDIQQVTGSVEILDGELYLNTSGYYGADYYFQNDDNGGMALYKDGDATSKLRVVSNKIGINVNTPSATLEVAKGSEGQYLVVGGDNASNGRALVFTSSTSISNGALHTINASSTNGALAFSTAGNEAIRINSSGSVGIGTNSVASTLHVKTSTDSTVDQGLVIERSANTDRGYINYQGGGFQFRATDGDPLVFGQVSDQRMRIGSDGNIGIGTTSAGAKLHLFNAGYPQMSLQSNGGTWQVGVSSGNDFAFRKGTTGSDYPLWLDSSGYVGVGTTSPNAPLAVVGTGPSAVGTINLKGISPHLGFTSGSGTFRSWVGHYNAGVHGSDADLNIKTGYGTTGNIRISADGDTTAAQMYLQGSTGRVGIGTTSPSGDLEISGSGNSNRTITFNPGFNDDISISSMGTDASGWNAVTLGQANSQNNSAAIRFKYTGAGSTNNYLGLGFYANDDKLVIRANGNVGIGTADPNHALDIYSNTNVPLRIHRPSNANLDSSGAWGIGFSTRGDTNKSTTDTRAGIFSAYNGDLFFAVNAGGRVDDDPDGNIAMWIEGANRYVGIGTTSPQSRLDVRPNDGTSDPRYIRTHFPAAGDYNSASTNTEERVPAGLRFGWYANYWQIGGARSGDSNIDGFVISDTGDERLVISNVGNVGIGTTTPSAKLHIGDGTTSVFQRFNSSNGGAINFQKSGTNSAFVGEVQQGLGSGDGLLLYTYSGGDRPIRFYPGGSEKVRFAQNGNVGIGTTNPISKLDVEGVLTIGGSSNSATAGSVAIQDDYSGNNHLANIGWTRSSGGPYLAYGVKQDGSADWKSTIDIFSSKRSFAKLDEDSFVLAYATSSQEAVDNVIAMTSKFNFNLEAGSLNINRSTASGTGRLVIEGGAYEVTGSGQAREGLDIKTDVNPGSGNYGAAISLGANGSGRAAISSFQGTADSDNQGLAFFTHGSTGAADASLAMVINSTGNVGINTNGPKDKLVIQGAGSYNWDSGGSERLSSVTTVVSDEMTDSAYHSILQLVSVRQSLTTGNAANGFLGFSTVDDSNGQGMRDAGRIAIVNESGSSRNSATALSFWTNPGGSTSTVAPTEKMRILSSGGITFNGDTAAANALDDYEEGTFTPVVGDGTYTYTNRRGHYVKIGNMVYVHIGFRLATASPGTSTASISGLPYAGINYGSYQEPHARIAVGGAFVTSNLSYNLSFYLSNSSSTLYARTSSGNADTPVASNAIWQAGTFIKYSLLYTVS